jgi:hypothetical protein
MLLNIVHAPILIDIGSLINLWAAEIMFTCAAYGTSLSLLAFYYRLTHKANIRWFNWLLWASIIFNSLDFWAYIFLEIFQCKPISAFWTYPPPDNAKCVSPKIILFAGGCTKFFIDITTTTLPIPLISRLPLSRSRKYVGIGLIALGYIVVAAGAIRVYFSYYILWDNYDQTWYQYWAFVAATIENDLAVICACVPGMRPVFDKLFVRLGWNGFASEVLSPLQTYRSEVTWTSQNAIVSKPKPSFFRWRKTGTKEQAEQERWNNMRDIPIQRRIASIDAMNQLYFGNDYEQKYGDGDGDSPMSSGTRRSVKSKR